METKCRLRGLLARLLIVTITSAGVSPQSHAATISTEAATASDRERILVLLDRPDVSAQLEAYGVKAVDAKARIAALTDAEVAQLAAGIDNAPAGGFIQVIAVALVGFAYAVVLIAGLAVAVVVGTIRGLSHALERGNGDTPPPAADKPGDPGAADSAQR